MTNSIYTPGPWAFCNDTLCQATARYLHLGKWVESPGLGKEAEGNKRLIEAAPELLDALEQLVNAVGLYTNAVAEDWPELQTAHLAIAKATNQE